MGGLTSTTAYKQWDNQWVDHCIERMAQKDPQALEQLYNLIGGALYAFILAILRNPQNAEDVLHDTFLKVYTSAQTYVSQGKPMAWIYTIARSLSLMRLRQGNLVLTFDDDIWIHYLADLPEFTSDDRLVLESAMSTLSDVENQIVTLHAASGFRHREIATLLDLPLATVLSKYHRAMKKLKKCLKEESE